MHPKILEAKKVLENYRSNHLDDLDITSAIDAILKDLNDDIENEELAKKIRFIESINFSRFGKKTTVGTMLKENNMESITKYVPFKDNLSISSKEKSFKQAFFTRPLPKLHFDEALMTAQKALLDLYKIRSEPQQQVTYSPDDINNSHKAREFLNELEISPKSTAEVDFSRDVVFEGIETKGLSKEEIQEKILQATGSKVMADFVLNYGGQTMNHFAIFEFLNSVKFKDSGQAENGKFTGTIRWYKDENNNLYCKVHLELKTIKNPNDPGEYGLGIYSMNKNGDLVPLDESQVGSLRDKENLSNFASLAVIDTTLKVQEVNGKAVPELTEYSTQLLTHDLVHGEKPLPKQALNV